MELKEILRPPLKIPVNLGQAIEKVQIELRVFYFPNLGKLRKNGRPHTRARLGQWSSLNREKLFVNPGEIIHYVCKINYRLTWNIKMDFFRSMFVFIRSGLFVLACVPIGTLAENSVSLLNNNPYSLGLDLGLAKPTNIGKSTTFPLGYSTFAYSSNNNDTHAVISGVSVNKTLPINSLYTLQAGISYHYISGMNAKGNLEQGISSPYYQSTYSYRVKSSQYLVEAKLHRQFYHYFPYVFLGLGMASNSAYSYSTAVPNYLTVTPNYSDRTTNSFSYSLGIGVDYFVMPKLSIGLGYRFINLGKVGLGTGVIRNTRVGAELTQSNLYINTLLAQLNYFI